jgi:hypothetical protein
MMSSECHVNRLGPSNSSTVRSRVPKKTSLLRIAEKARYWPERPKMGTCSPCAYMFFLSFPLFSVIPAQAGIQFPETLDSGSGPE